MNNHGFEGFVYGIALQKYNGNEKKVYIEDDVCIIQAGAFENCESVVEVVIGDGCTEIGERAFSGCKNLEKVVIGDGTLKICDLAFSGCEKLREVTVGKSLKYLGENAFYGCKSLEKVSLPALISSIAPGAFARTDIREINIPQTEYYDYYYKYDMLLYGKEGKDILCWANTKDVDIVEVHEGVYLINTKAFFDSEVSEVILPESVKSISEYAFYRCQNLESVTIGENVKSISEMAFSCLPAKFTLKCKENSYAHKFAVLNDIKFELIEEKEEEITTDDGSIDFVAAIRRASKMLDENLRKNNPNNLYCRTGDDDFEVTFEDDDSDDDFDDEE